MQIALEAGQLDQVAPFAIVCEPDLTIARVGPSLEKALGRDVAGLGLFDAFVVERPRVDSVASLLAHPNATFLLRSVGAGLTLRCQLIRANEGTLMVFLGAPALSTDDELGRLGLRYSDFAAWDPTPDVLILKTAQERSLHDLAQLNTELSRTADRLRETNSALTDAERRYRELVEHQPLVTYIDGIDETVTTQFTSENVFELTGYTAQEWGSQANFFFGIVDPEDVDRVHDEHVAAARSGAPYRGEFRLVRRDGARVWIQAADRIVRDDDGTPLYRLGYMLDVTESRLAAERLREAGGRLRTLVSNLQAGVMVEDGDRRVVLTNSEFCGIFGIDAPPDALIGTDCSTAAARAKHLAKDPEGFMGRVDEILAAGVEIFGEEVEFADGRVFERDFIPLILDSTSHGQMWSYRDVTQRTEVQRDVERARAEAVAASEAKSEFLAVVSHEIRTPMHGVLGAVDILQGTALDPEQQSLTSIVKRSATSLLDLINDMLDLQRAESGQMELVEEPLDARVLVADVLDTVRARADEKEIVLRSMFHGVPASLVGDPVRIRQILLNLVGNAVKFTDAGHVAVDVYVADAPDGRTTATFEVEDSGVGIAPEDQKRIFEPFTQSDASTRRRHEGSGLGLAITRQLVELMHGTIRLESQAGAGTRVVVAVPLRLGTQEIDAARTTSARPRRLEGRVLVVEDSEVNRELAVRQLEALGVEAVTAASGEEALLELDRGRFDAVLMDLRMPGMDGLETTRAIRAREREVGSGNVPIVAVTANAMEVDREASLAAGMDGFASKPLLLETLAATLARWLKGGPEAETRESAATPDGASDNVHEQLDYLAADLGGREAVERLAETWLRELPVRLQAAHEAFADGDRAVLRATAHVLKSTCAMVGANAAAAMAAEIETAAAGDDGQAVDVDDITKLEESASAAATAVTAWRREGEAVPVGP
jgi:PAS domain S-box-containing protein